MLWVALPALCLALVVLVLASRRRRRLVLGLPMAEAWANERARLATSFATPSPMPADAYEVDRGDHNFISVEPLALDLKLQALVRRFAQGSAVERRGMTAALSLGELYTLLHFAKRCAVLAMKETATAWCEDGLVALAMIDETRIDWRDASIPAGLLSYAMAATSADRDVLVGRALSLSREGMRSVVESARVPRSLSDCMYLEVRADDGAWGLIETGLARYEPTIAMTEVALQVARWLEGGRYAAAPVVAEQLPSVWFAKEHRQDVERLVQRAHAGILVRGTLRKEHGVDPQWQPFIVWVLEMENEREAALLNTYVGTGNPLDSRFAAGIARGPLFGILVAGSSCQGVAPFETQQSVAALAKEVGPILEGVLKL